jgi:hypothetical protein
MGIMPEVPENRLGLFFPIHIGTAKVSRTMEK